MKVISSRSVDFQAKATPIVSLAVGILAFAGYVWLAPGVSGHGDSSELTLVLARDGVAHPTGYPLYTMFGHPFVAALHALGVSWPMAANAWSALGAAVALLLMHRLGVRLGMEFSGRPGRLRERNDAPHAVSGATHPALPWSALALLPVTLLALNPAWIPEATLAEVHSWHLAWVMGALLVFVKITNGFSDAPDASRDSGRARPRALRPAFGWGLLCGAGLAHHVSSILVVAPLSLAILLRLRRRSSAGSSGAMRSVILPRVLAALAGAALPLAAYTLIYVKALRPAPGQWIYLAPGWNGFWRHVTGAQYQGALLRFGIAPADREMLAGSIAPFLVPGLVILGVLAMTARSPRPRWILIALAAVAFLQTAFGFAYGVDDRAAYFLPPLALGLAAIVPALAPLNRAGARRRPAVLASAAVLVILAVTLSIPWLAAARRLQRDQEGLDAMLRSMWGSIHEEQGIVIWNHDMHQRLVEYQVLRGEKPGLEVLNLWTILDPARRRWFATRHGFDPIGDIPLPPPAALAATETSAEVRAFFLEVSRRINARTKLPVILFDPDIPLVKRMNKPGPG